MGIVSPGVVFLDVSGTHSRNKAKPYFCKDGVTYIIKRGQFGLDKV